MPFAWTIHRHRTIRFGLLAIACSLLSSVSAAAELEGCWEGTWRSCVTGHKGVLRATITRCDDLHYRADFEGTFFKFLPFRYSIVLTVTQPGDPVEFQGQQDLGRLAGGVYHYTGHATDCEFHAHYCAKKDEGLFVMRRVCCCNK
jgi:hypothetical protein